MTPLLAQLSDVPADLIKNLGLIVAALLAAAYYARGLMNGDRPQKRELTQQPISVKAADQFVTRESYGMALIESARRMDEFDRKLEALRSELKVDRDAFMKQLLHEVGSVHTRVNQVLEAVSELRGQVHAKTPPHRP